MRGSAAILGLMVTMLGSPTLAQPSCVSERKSGPWTAQLGNFMRTDGMERFLVIAYRTVYLEAQYHSDDRVTYEGTIIVWNALLSDLGRSLAGHSFPAHPEVPARIVVRSYDSDLTQFDIVIKRASRILSPDKDIYEQQARMPDGVAELILSYLSTGSDVELLFTMPDPGGGAYKVRNSLLLSSDGYYAAQEGLSEDYEQKGARC